MEELEIEINLRNKLLELRQVLKGEQESEYIQKAEALIIEIQNLFSIYKSEISKNSNNYHTSDNFNDTNNSNNTNNTNNSNNTNINSKRIQRYNDYQIGFSNLIDFYKQCKLVSSNNLNTNSHLENATNINNTISSEAFSHGSLVLDSIKTQSSCLSNAHSNLQAVQIDLEEGDKLFSFSLSLNKKVQLILYILIILLILLLLFK